MKLASLLKDTKKNKYDAPNSFQMANNGVTVTNSTWTPEQTRAFSRPVTKPAQSIRPVRNGLARIHPVYSFSDTGEKKDAFTRMTKENSPDSNWKERLAVNTVLAKNQGQLKDRRLQGLNRLAEANFSAENQTDQIKLQDQLTRTRLQELNKKKPKKTNELSLKDRANLLMKNNKDYEQAKLMGQITPDENGTFMDISTWTKKANPMLHNILYNVPQDDTSSGSGPKTGKMRKLSDGSYTNILPTAKEAFEATKKPKLVELTPDRRKQSVDKLTDDYEFTAFGQVIAP